MKYSNHWKIWLLLLPIIGSAEVFVHPTREGVATGLHLSMPKSEWTNCVAWYSAEFPTIESGALDLSPAGNDADPWDAHETVTNFPRVITFTSGNGAYACQNAIPDLIAGRTYRLRMTYSRSNDVGTLYISSGGFDEVSRNIGTDGNDAEFDMICTNPAKPLRFVNVSRWTGTISKISLRLLPN